jgi:hypothetical protein
MLFPNMPHALLTATLTLLLGGCVASAPEIDSSESYSGPLIAAIAPMGGQVDQLTGWVLRHELEQALAKQLRASAIFSAVEELPSATTPNEAEVIIEPTFLQQDGQSILHRGQDELTVHLRVRTKTTGAVAIDRDYRVPCAQCGLGTVEPQAVNSLAKAISDDMRQKFGKPAVK